MNVQKGATSKGGSTMFPWLSMLVITVLLGSVWRLFLRSWKKVTKKHLVVISADSQATIEWWVRSYMFWNWIHGTPCRCTCIDLGSRDDTVTILERLQRRFEWIEVKRWESMDRERPIEQLITHLPPDVQVCAHVLDLRQPHNRRARSIAQDLS